MKELKNLQGKSSKESLIKFKNDLIMKNKINNRIRKILMAITEKINLSFLKILDIYLMKKISLHMRISGICLMKLHLNQ